MDRIFDMVSDFIQKASDIASNDVKLENETYLHKKDKALYFAINKSRSVNASVKLLQSQDQTSSVYDIRVNTGVLINLYILALSLLSHEEVMPDYEMADFPVVFGEEFGLKISEIDWGDSLESQIIELSNKDVRLFVMHQRRALGAKVIALSAFLFFFFHEIGHARRGHVDYLYRLSRKAFKEYDNSNKLSGISSQALELHADSYAGLCIASSLSVYSDIETARLTGFGVGLVFQTFDFKYTPHENYKHSSHPHPGLRLIYTISGMMGRARNEGVIIPQELEDSFVKGAIESAGACRLVGKETALSSSISSEQSKISLRSRMSEILDELDHLCLNYIPKTIW